MLLQYDTAGSPDCQASPHEQKLLRLHVASSLHAIEIYSAREIAGVELDFVVAGVDVAVNQLSDVLAEGVENSERYM